MASSQPGVVSCVMDTDIVIDYLRGREYAKSLLERWARDGLLAVSVITHAEVYHGMRLEEAEATTAFLDGLVSIPVDVTLARNAGSLLRGLRPRGLKVGVADAIVAATALALNVPLLTNNVEHYPFPGLKVVKAVLP